MSNNPEPSWFTHHCQTPETPLARSDVVGVACASPAISISVGKGFWSRHSCSRRSRGCGRADVRRARARMLSGDGELHYVENENLSSDGIFDTLKMLSAFVKNREGTMWRVVIYLHV